MKAHPLDLPDVLLLDPKVFGDDRGFFFESYNAKLFTSLTGVTTKFVQDNHSKSTQGVLRGIHYQLEPKAQGKLIRVIAGEVFDVAVDLRRSSPNFGKWVGAHLSAENKKQIWVPAGFGHAFLTLSGEAEVLYKTTDYYSPEHERSIIWNDDMINIKWPSDVSPKLSEKDLNAAPLATAEVFE